MFVAQERLPQRHRGASISNFMVLVVLVDSFCTYRDIDARAGGGQPPDAIWILTDTCLALYCLEMIVPYHMHSGSLCVVVVVGGGGLLLFVVVCCCLLFVV